MNKYKWFYRGRTGYLEAKTSYEAQTKVAKLCSVKPKMAYLIAVVLVESEGRLIEQRTSDI